MKDELDGQVITKAYFLGIKRYCLELPGGVIKSVFAGVPKNSLSWNDYEKLASGESLKRELPNTFFKSFKDMTITIKPRHTTMLIKNDKSLINNEYISLDIKSLKVRDEESIFNSDILKYTKILQKYNK